MDYLEESSDEYQETTDTRIIPNILCPSMPPLTVSERVIADLAWKASKLPRSNELAYNLGECLDAGILRAIQKATMEGKEDNKEMPELKRYVTNTTTSVLERQGGKTPCTFSLGLDKIRTQNILSTFLNTQTLPSGKLKDDISLIQLNEVTRIFKVKELEMSEEERYSGDVIVVFRNRAGVQEPPVAKSFIVKQVKCINEIAKGAVDGQYSMTEMVILDKDQTDLVLKSTHICSIQSHVCRIKNGSFIYEFKYMPNRREGENEYNVSLIMNMGELSELSTKENKEERLSEANVLKFFSVIQEYMFRSSVLRRMAGTRLNIQDCPAMQKIKKFMNFD